MSQGIEGELAALYDVFVDWPGRLGREMPGLTARLRAAGARRVLDAGCGTGRHVRALLDAGFDAHGADLSEDMLAQARTLCGGAERFHCWRMGEPPPDRLRAAAPFDAIVSLGNVWPQLLAREEVRSACRAFRELARPEGLVLLGLKAVAVRREKGRPYLPLLRREHQGRVLFFVRFVDFAAGDDPELCDFHMLVVPADAATVDPLLHRRSRMRVWDPPGLVAALTEAGLRDVRASARLDDPSAPPTGEDLFLHART